MAHRANGGNGANGANGVNGVNGGKRSKRSIESPCIVSSTWTTCTLMAHAQVVYKNRECSTCLSVTRIWRHTSFKAARRFITLSIRSGMDKSNAEPYKLPVDAVWLSEYLSSDYPAQTHLEQLRAALQAWASHWLF